MINLCVGTEAQEAIKAAPAALEEPVTRTLCKISQMRCSEANLEGQPKSPGEKNIPGRRNSKDKSKGLHVHSY